MSAENEWLRKDKLTRPYPSFRKYLLNQLFSSAFGFGVLWGTILTNLIWLYHKH